MKYHKLENVPMSFHSQKSCRNGIEVTSPVWQVAPVDNQSSASHKGEALGKKTWKNLKLFSNPKGNYEPWRHQQTWKKNDFEVDRSQNNGALELPTAVGVLLCQVGDPSAMG